MSRFCFTLTCDLKEDAPQQVIDTLKYMTRVEEHEFMNPPKAAFFENDDWRSFLICDEQRYFTSPGTPHATFQRVYRYTLSAARGGADVFLYTLSFRCEGKDDSITYCVALLEWIAPYSATKGYVGYWKYADSEEPILVYFRDGEVWVSEPQSPHKIRE